MNYNHQTEYFYNIDAQLNATQLLREFILQVLTGYYNIIPMKSIQYQYINLINNYICTKVIDHLTELANNSLYDI